MLPTKAKFLESAPVWKGKLALTYSWALTYSYVCPELK